MAFWYNINTQEVETDEDRGPGEDLMGPYASEAEARAAIATAAQNTERWDDEDEAWENQGFEGTARD